MDYVWTQTETTLYINVPLKGTNAGKVDIVCTDDYLKVKFWIKEFCIFTVYQVLYLWDSSQSETKLDCIAFFFCVTQNWDILKRCTAVWSSLWAATNSAAVYIFERFYQCFCSHLCEKEKTEKKYININWHDHIKLSAWDFPNASLKPPSQPDIFLPSPSVCIKAVSEHTVPYPREKGN